MTAAQTKDKRSPRQKKRLVWLTEAQAALSWFVILVLVALLGAIYLFQTSRTAAVGRHIQNLQYQLDEAKRVNSDLERDIAEAQALDRLEAEAARLGFVPAQPEDIEYLVVPDYPQQVDLAGSSELKPVPEPIETIDEVIWLVIEKSFSNLVQGEAP